ncbi:MAG: hypothetical protein VX790_00490 [Bacteroidota bacterium]|nr:hypothetical protein [Bacteroidota bacterium]
MKDRRAFLKEVCPTVAFAFFGVSFLEACSADSLEEDTGDGNTTPTDNNGSSDNGYTKNDSTYTIDLTHPNFSQLAEVGGWMNGSGIGIQALFLRTSSTDIQAYSNRCPAHGQRNRWDLLNNSTFKCNHKGNTYSTDCGNTQLDCFTTSLNGDELTLTM